MIDLVPQTFIAAGKIRAESKAECEKRKQCRLSCGLASASLQSKNRIIMNTEVGYDLQNMSDTAVSGTTL